MGGKSRSLLTTVVVASSLGLAGLAIGTVAPMGLIQPIVVSADWKTGSQGWWYDDGNGKFAQGWRQINGPWYYFDNNGWMKTGWQEIGGVWYYFASNGYMQTNWQQIGGTWYYFDAQGHMLTNWQKLGDNWFYFNPQGHMLTNWQKLGDNWFYFDEQGHMLKGWQQVGGSWYYFDDNGHMLTGKQIIGGDTYYFDGSGHMQTGWQNIDGKTYYFDSSGKMVKSTKIGDTTFDANGVAGYWHSDAMVKYSPTDGMTAPNNYLFYAIKSVNPLRDDGLYKNSPYNTADDSIWAGSTKNYNGTIVYADAYKNVTDYQGNSITYVHVNLNGSWYWVDRRGLSYQTNPGTSPAVLGYNAYNHNGQVPYYSSSKYSSELDRAAQHWNQILGTNVFVKMSSLTHDTQLEISDVQLTTSDYLMGTYGSLGRMFVNTGLIGQRTTAPNGGSYDYTNSDEIEHIFEHELGHSIGLNHTGFGTGTGNYGWSWSNESDLMWGTNLSGSISDQSVVTQNDIAGVNLVRSMHMYYDTADPILYSNISHDGSGYENEWEFVPPVAK
ncbi:M57 family metalloprotease [Furfurilactobacillus rossiae]|uniref:M57 family metalloprotease n=1 Tax=Furfurilactobacillus rossiae TaxID=231049 RepID=UPI0002FA81C8|nr:M57 family metalloprotease [Furfurilactobacillus rossiae]QLE60983.1 Choline binding protein A [Furfurilactobacillus rossiae]